MPTKRQKLIKKLDSVFSQYVRLRACNEAGYGHCWTCNSERHWREVDAGHFMSRICMSTRWHEQNVQFQCKRCNGFKGGEQYVYAVRLDQVFGPGTAEKLMYQSKTTRKFSIPELEQMIDIYTRKVAEVKAEKGIE